jgi:hypothetical protein
MIFFLLLPGHLKFLYDQTNYKRVLDAYSMMSNVIIEYDLVRKIYSLDPVDAKSLGEFVGKY